MPKRKKSNKTPEQKTATNQHNMAKAAAARDIFKSLKDSLAPTGIAETDPIFRIYRKVDLRGFNEGSPIFQGGMEPQTMTNVMLHVRNTQDQHQIYVKMEHLIRAISEAALDVAGEIKAEQFEG